MARVTGIGGVFLLASDAPALQAWYREHLGIDVQAWGGAAFETSGEPTTTAWSIAARGEGDFAPGRADFMVNYRVDDLLELVEALRREGCEVLDDVQESEYGSFAWVIDPEGNKVELWQPPPAG